MDDRAELPGEAGRFERGLPVFLVDVELAALSVGRVVAAATEILDTAAADDDDIARVATQVGGGAEPSLALG